MNVSEIMSEGPVSVKEGDFVTHARQLMRDHLLRGLVVVDEEKQACRNAERPGYP